jgi:hypothetical protein
LTIGVPHAKPAQARRVVTRKVDLTIFQGRPRCG